MLFERLNKMIAEENSKSKFRAKLIFFFQILCSPGFFEYVPSPRWTGGRYGETSVCISYLISDCLERRGKMPGELKITRQRLFFAKNKSRLSCLYKNKNKWHSSILCLHYVKSLHLVQLNYLGKKFTWNKKRNFVKIIFEQKSAFSEI